jgi:hypothetical protein
MSDLYIEELKTASAASLGKYEGKDGDGDHKQSKKRNRENEQSPNDASRPRTQ